MSEAADLARKIRGSCLCGAVAFELAGELTPIQLCHAMRCRKASGAAYAPELLAPRGGLTWLHGEANVTVYDAPILEDPPAYRRTFCTTCGSPLPTPLGDSEWVILNPGVLDDDPGSRPFRHAFLREKASWHEPTDDLPRFEGRPPRPESIP